MLRLILIAMTAITLVAANVGETRADTIYVEDFENDGEPGFDPMFNHEFDLSHSQYANWELTYYYRFSEHGTVLGMYGDARDWITFDLNTEQSVEYASVDFWVSSDVEPSEYIMVDFVGLNATQHVYLYHSDDYETISISSDDIGSITGIRIRSNGENFFDNITIRVVPEPYALAGLFFLMLWFSWRHFRKRRLQRQIWTSRFCDSRSGVS